jgi:hypothetical protein
MSSPVAGTTINVGQLWCRNSSVCGCNFNRLSSLTLADTPQHPSTALCLASHKSLLPMSFLRLLLMPRRRRRTTFARRSSARPHTLTVRAANGPSKWEIKSCCRQRICGCPLDLAPNSQLSSWAPFKLSDKPPLLHSSCLCLLQSRFTLCFMPLC